MEKKASLYLLKVNRNVLLHCIKTNLTILSQYAHSKTSIYCAYHEIWSDLFESDLFVCLFERIIWWPHVPSLREPQQVALRWSCIATPGATSGEVTSVFSSKGWPHFSLRDFNLRVEVFQHMVPNRRGAGLSNLPEEARFLEGLPGTVTSFVPNLNATMTSPDISAASLLAFIWISKRLPCDISVECLDCRRWRADHRFLSGPSWWTNWTDNTPGHKNRPYWNQLPFYKTKWWGF